MSDLLQVIILIIWLIGFKFSLDWRIATKISWVNDEDFQCYLDVAFAIFWPIGWIVQGIIMCCKKSKLIKDKWENYY